jgi:hypothetical protein
VLFPAEDQVAVDLVRADGNTSLQTYLRHALQIFGSIHLSDRVVRLQSRRAGLCWGPKASQSTLYDPSGCLVSSISADATGSLAGIGWYGCLTKTPPSGK